MHEQHSEKQAFKVMEQLSEVTLLKRCKYHMEKDFIHISVFLCYVVTSVVTNHKVVFI